MVVPVAVPCGLNARLMYLSTPVAGRKKAPESREGTILVCFVTGIAGAQIGTYPPPYIFSNPYSQVLLTREEYSKIQAHNSAERFSALGQSPNRAFRLLPRLWKSWALSISMEFMGHGISLGLKDIESSYGATWSACRAWIKVFNEQGNGPKFFTLEARMEKMVLALGDSRGGGVLGEGDGRKGFFFWMNTAHI